MGAPAKFPGRDQHRAASEPFQEPRRQDSGRADPIGQRSPPTLGLSLPESSSAVFLRGVALHSNMVIDPVTTRNSLLVMLALRLYPILDRLLSMATSFIRNCTTLFS